MKHEKWLTPLWAAVLAFLAALGGAGCLVTGFAIENVSAQAVVAVCVAGAVIFSLCCYRKVGWAPLCLLALLGGYLWRKGPLEQSVEALLYHITTLYDCGYGWGVVWWTGQDPAPVDTTLALCTVGLLVAASVAYTVARRCSCWPGVTAVALPLAACMVLTDSVPQEQYLCMVLTVVIMLLMTQSVRRKSEKSGNTLSAMVLLPVILSLVVLLVAIPRAGYDGQAGAQKIEDFVVQLLGLEDEPVPDTGIVAVGDMTSDQVSLDAVGPKSDQASKVMDVNSAARGTMYLRGCAYDVYDGRSWSATQDKWALDQEYQVSGQAWSVTVSTRNPHEVLYMPGISHQLTRQMYGGRVENTGEKTRYTLQCTALPKYDGSWEQYGGGVNTQTARQYLQLPDSTRSQARAMVLDKLGIPPVNGSAGEIWRYAQKVAELVKHAALYDLNAQAMPPEEEDFALWFYEKSDRGYCVHFATTTAVLLRSAGIPTRYVTGYLVNIKDSMGTMVRLRDAHAWVEVYLPVVGWVTLEATPGGEGSPIPPPEDLPAFQPIFPSEMEPTGAATQASQATEPSQVEKPTLPPATEPSYNSAIGGMDAPEKTEAQGGSRLPWLLLGVAALSALVGQWQLRLWLRRKKQYTGTANQQALARWQEVVLHGKLGAEIPETLLALAQKAKFSQHTLSRQELRQFEVYLSQSRKALRRAPLWKQLYCTLVLAIV